MGSPYIPINPVANLTYRIAALVNQRATGGVIIFFR